MSAVRALEDILKVRHGYLESMVESHTPGSPGWWNSVVDLEKLVQHGSDLSKAVDELGADFRDTIHRQFVVDTIRFDERRAMREVHSIEILQARNDGTRHHIIITSGEELLDDDSIEPLTSYDLHFARPFGEVVVSAEFLPDNVPQRAWGRHESLTPEGLDPLPQ